MISRIMMALKETDIIGNEHEEIVKLTLETSKVELKSRSYYSQTLTWRASKNINKGAIMMLFSASKVDVNLDVDSENYGLCCRPRQAR